MQTTPESPANISANRTLGRTGIVVEAVSLGGEGILRTHGREREAVAMIVEALRLGVRYCDTAPAYAQSQDYYGAAFREVGREARARLTLASKTHARDRDGALRLLDDSLRRLGTEWLDIWQMHDLRTMEELDELFAKNGALAAALHAREQKRIRYIGITGHHDPAVLVEALRRFAFDTVLCAINPADPRRLPFLTTVVPAARSIGAGIVGMKALAHGLLTAERAAPLDALLAYSATHADTVVVGCDSPAQVRENLAAGRKLKPMSTAEQRELEARLAPSAARYDTFKR